LNDDDFSGTLSPRGETEAGSAGTQPARDNLAEASKRREGAARSGFIATGRAAQFFCGQSTSHAQGSARRSGAPLRPHYFPPFPTRHFDASHASQNPGVRGSAPSATEAVLHRDPLDDVASDTTFATVVQARCSWISVARQILHVFQRNTLFQQVSDGRYTKGMRRQT